MPGCGYSPFETGKRYLVEAALWENGEFIVGGCGNITRPLERAGPLIRQLRVIRDHGRPASLFGAVKRVQKAELGGLQPNYDRVLPHVAIRAISRTEKFQTVSDENGEYRFYGLPRGSYRFEADLPAGLKIGQTILSTPPPLVKLGWNQCFESDITALPTGEIGAEVVDTSGRPLDYLFVSLFSASEFEKGEMRGRSADTGYYFHPIRFSRLAPGEYVLTLSEHQAYAPASTFSAAPLRFVLHEGEKLSVLRLEVRESAPVCNVPVNLNGCKGAKYEVRATPGRGELILSQSLDPGSISLRLLKGVEYKISAVDLATGKNCLSRPVVVGPADICPDEIDLQVPETCH